MSAFSSLVKSWANAVSMPSGVSRMKPSVSGLTLFRPGGGGKRLADLCNVLVCIWGKRGNVDQASPLRVISCLGDYHSTIGMAYEDYRAIFCGDCALGCCNIFSERG